MIRLCEINESNWLEAVGLTLREDQKKFLDSPLGIIARGYVYRSHRARVLGVYSGGSIAGLMLIKDLDEEPACYDLQQFLIDSRLQGRGFGSRGLELVLQMLSKERKYGCVEVCVDKSNFPALRLFEKSGFADTGYTDPDLPDQKILRYVFPALDAVDSKDGYIKRF